MALQILKSSKLKKLVLEHSGRDQAASDSLDRIDELVTNLLVKVAEAAGKSAKESNLVRIMPENIDAAFNEILSQSNVAPDPHQFVTALNAMPVTELGKVLSHIADWTADDDKRKS